MASDRNRRISPRTANGEPVLSILDKVTSDSIPPGSEIAFYMEAVCDSYIWNNDWPNMLDKVVVHESPIVVIILLDGNFGQSWWHIKPLAERKKLLTSDSILAGMEFCTTISTKRWQRRLLFHRRMSAGGISIGTTWCADCRHSIRPGRPRHSKIVGHGLFLYDSKSNQYPGEEPRIGHTNVQAEISSPCFE